MTYANKEELVTIFEEAANNILMVGYLLAKMDNSALREFTYIRSKLILDDGEYFLSLLHSDGAKLKYPDGDKSTKPDKNSEEL